MNKTIEENIALRKLVQDAVKIIGHTALVPGTEHVLYNPMKTWIETAGELLTPALLTLPRQRFLSDVVIGAVDAITYWAEVKEYNPDEFEASFNVREDADSGEGFQLFDTEAVAKGIGLILDGSCHVNDSILGWVAEDNADNDAANIDGLAADCIVQAALFGKLIYG